MDLALADLAWHANPREDPAGVVAAASTAAGGVVFCRFNGGALGSSLCATLIVVVGAAPRARSTFCSCGALSTSQEMQGGKSSDGLLRAVVVLAVLVDHHHHHRLFRRVLRPSTGPPPPPRSRPQKRNGGVYSLYGPAPGPGGYPLAYRVPPHACPPLEPPPRMLPRAQHQQCQWQQLIHP